VPAFVWEGELLLAGTGPSDHASALFASGTEDTASDLLRTLADSVAEPFNRIDLQQLASSSPLLHIRIDNSVGASESADPTLALALEGEEGLENVPKKMRSNWRYSVRRLEREGARIDVVSEEEAAGAVSELERLHSIRWRPKGEPGVLADELAARHLRLAIPELARAGLLRMHRLHREGEAIGILFAMRGAHSTCYYLGGFDPKWARLSPGTALVGSAIAYAASEGCTEFDFLRGQEGYKYGWGATERPMLRRIIILPAPVQRATPTRRAGKAADDTVANARDEPLGPGAHETAKEGCGC
jgi:CelD/BcsL family acetyltransferase involved in cellulose biosynthesis